jgi:hypothetical protein
MYEKVKLVLVVLLALVFGVSALARHFPDIGWLQRLRYDPPRLSEAQRAKIRRRANFNAGVELILMGVIVPIGYVMLTVMLFSNFSGTAMAVVFASSALCICLGITAIWQSRRE